MAVKKDDYEEFLATCSSYAGAIELLRRYRPYLELLPSIRRPSESIVTIPLPNIRVRQASTFAHAIAGEVVPLPCDVALLMCDPEWKIKTGVEIFVFIHRPQEDFSELLTRWRQTQILLDKGYEWLMPARYSYLLNDGADSVHPLFVIFPGTPERIQRGLHGAGLPFAVHEPLVEPDPSEDDLSLRVDEQIDYDIEDLGK